MAIQVIVVAAFFDTGSRKAGTPFEIASIPVNAVQPEEKARSSKNSVSPSTAGTGGTWCSTGGPKSVRPKPMRITNARVPTKRYVGTAKILPDSRTPRRFPQVRMTIETSPKATRCSCRAGNADVIAATPAATLTATVRT